MIEKTAHENQTDKAEISLSHQKTLEQNEKSNSELVQVNPKLWEQRYEKMWIENEKRDLKTNFKNITAELKQMFGEINETEKTTTPTEGTSEDGFSEELESIQEAPLKLTKPTNHTKRKGEFGDLQSVLEQKESSYENLIPKSPDQYVFKASCEPIWNVNEESCTKDEVSTKIAETKEVEDQVSDTQIKRNADGNTILERNVDYSQKYILEEGTFLQNAQTLDILRPVSTDDKNKLSGIVKRNIEKDLSQFNDNVPKDCFVSNPKISKTEIENNLKTSQQSCDDTLKRQLDEELEQDMERFKNEVGMLQIVFLALEKEKVQLQKEVEVHLLLLHIL